MANEKRLIKLVDATAVHNGIALYMAENAYLNDSALDVLKMVARWLNEAPIVDAVEVVHGRWNEINQMATGLPWKYRCNECGCPQDYKHNYCPNCGAKMDGGNEDV